MSTLEVPCSACGEQVNVHVAKIADDCDYDLSIENVRYFCPVCAIQAKNAAMHAGMLRAIN